MRQKLASLDAFEPYASFTRIDRSNYGHISAKEISAYLKENDIFEFLESEVNLVVKYFDSE